MRKKAVITPSFKPGTSLLSALGGNKKAPKDDDFSEDCSVGVTVIIAVSSPSFTVDSDFISVPLSFMTYGDQSGYFIKIEE